MSFCTSGGMLAIGNMKPEKNMFGSSRNCPAIDACCCVFEIADTSSPMPRQVRMNSPVSPNSSGTLPLMRTPNQKRPGEQHQRRC